MTTKRKEAEAAGGKARVQGETTEQTIKSSAGVLWRIVVTNGATDVQTLTVTDGSTTLGVYEIGADVTEVWEFQAHFDTNIKVTPSDAGIDALVIFD